MSSFGFHFRPFERRPTKTNGFDPCNRIASLAATAACPRRRRQTGEVCATCRQVNCSGATTRVKDQRQHQVAAAQIRLLYDNAYTGIGVTIIAAPLLAIFQWDAVRHPVVLAWLLYMLLLSAARLFVTRAYRRRSAKRTDINLWNTAFAIGAGLAAAGWGSAGTLLYAEDRLINQVFLVFVLGGNDARRCFSAGSEIGSVSRISAADRSVAGPAFSRRRRS